MPTVRDVVTFALRLGKVVGVAASPTASEASMGVEALQSFYLQLASEGMFGRLSDLAIVVDTEGEPGRRYFASDGATITYPTEVRAGCGLRPPYDLSLIELIDTDEGTRSLKVWEAGRGAWVELVGLTPDDEAPLASRGAMGLAACLATSAAFLAIFSAQLDGTLLPLVRGFRGGLIGKGGSERDRPEAEAY
jgi:hypothetical protein